jgi:hypothetical protein
MVASTRGMPKRPGPELRIADAGRPRQARELEEEALAIWRRFNRHTGWCAAVLLELAELDATLGEPERVPNRLEQALEVFAHNGDQTGVVYCQKGLSDRANAALTAK